jgi:hypothetical protein
MGAGLYMEELDHQGNLTVNGVTFKDCISKAQGGGAGIDAKNPVVHTKYIKTTFKGC